MPQAVKLSVSLDHGMYLGKKVSAGYPYGKIKRMNVSFKFMSSVSCGHDVRELDVRGEAVADLETRHFCRFERCLFHTN